MNIAPQALPKYVPLVDNKVRYVTDDLRKHDGFRAEVMDEARRALYGHGDLDSLARKIGRTPRCLYALRGGYTRWPRWETLSALLPHLGLQLTIIRTAERYH